jgi:hypothetical protein
MIIQLLGANGAGKSTIMTNIMNGSESFHIYTLGRSVPDALEINDAVLVGHYRPGICGGADTVPRDRIHEVLKTLPVFKKPIIIEGPTGREPTLEGEIYAIHLRRDDYANLECWVKRNTSKGRTANIEVMLKRIRSATNRCDRIVSHYLSRGFPVITTGSRTMAEAEIRRLLRRT